MVWFPKTYDSQGKAAATPTKKTKHPKEKKNPLHVTWACVYLLLLATDRAITLPATDWPPGTLHQSHETEASPASPAHLLTGILVLNLTGHTKQFQSPPTPNTSDVEGFTRYYILTTHRGELVRTLSWLNLFQESPHEKMQQQRNQQIWRQYHHRTIFTLRGTHRELGHLDHRAENDS